MTTLNEIANFPTGDGPGLTGITHGKNPAENPVAPVFTLFPLEASRDFGRKPFVAKHSLAGDERFNLPRLVELAAALPADDVEYNPGDLPVVHDPAKTPRNGLSPEETIRRIEACRSWIVLKHVERDVTFGALLGDCLDEISSVARANAPGMTGRESFVFVSSPGSITPFHIDPEFNLLLQLRGTKEVHVFDGADRAIVSHQDLERFYDGGHRNLAWRDPLKALETVFHLGPGDALHIPVTTPHWVKNGPDVSISYSVTFRTRASAERDVLYKINHRLRRAGFDPLPPAASPITRAMKLAAFRALRRVKRLLR